MLKNLGILNHMSIKISLVAFTNEELSRREAKLEISKHHITSHASYGHVFTKSKAVYYKRALKSRRIDAGFKSST